LYISFSSSFFLSVSLSSSPKAFSSSFFRKKAFIFYKLFTAEGLLYDPFKLCHSFLKRSYLLF
jgi:hypothetical protein